MSGEPPEVLVIVDRPVLIRPVGRHVVDGPLQAHPPAVTGVERDPLIVVVGDALPAGELLVERGQAVDVRGLALFKG